ncbi:MAG: GDPmannose 4,6-dehydratase [Solirubrobacteraceae bacterium]|nr:GDPmannose 4,6-dehydratase [Solirubrobacteraceae bacterium]
MSRALITGVTGQDGSYLAELLVATGREVVGVARDPDAPAPNLSGVDVDLVAGDLRDPAGLRRVLADVAPDELFHLAAPTFVPASWEDPAGALAEIAGATATLLAAAAGTDMRVFVATSSEVFGDAGVSPQGEDSPMRPWSPYGVAKLAAHRLVGTYRRAGLHASSGITFNHESPRRPERFLPRKVTRGVAAIALGLERELSLGSLDAVRDWSAAQDIVRGALLAAEHDEPGDYVLASGVGRTVGDLVASAFARVGLDPADHVRVDPAFVRPPEATPPVGDPTRARRVLGWEPEISFDEMIGARVDADLAALRSQR